MRTTPAAIGSTKIATFPIAGLSYVVVVGLLSPEVLDNIVLGFVKFDAV